MDGARIIATAFRSFIGALIPPIKKRFFDQPKIYLVFERQGAGQANRGASSKNNPGQATFVSDVIYHFDLDWSYKLSLRNNSEHPAYNIKLKSPTGNRSFGIVPEIDPHKPILSNGEMTCDLRFYLSFEGTGVQSDQLIRGKPEALNQEFVLEYSNVSGTRFETHYNDNLDEEKKYSFLVVNSRTQKSILYGSAILIVGLVVASFFLFRANQTNKAKDSETDKLDTAKTEIEVKNNSINQLNSPNSNAQIGTNNSSK